jgi:hypothetical protein
MEPLFLSFASQLRVNVSSRPSSRLATGPDVEVTPMTLHVSFNPRGLPVPLTFHVFREAAHTANVGFVVRDA